FPQVTAPGASCKSLTININAFLSFSGATNLNIAGNYTNNGTFTPGSGTVTFNGTTAQTINKAGGEVFNNITFSGSGTKTLLSAITVNGNLTVNAGSGAFSANNFNVSISGDWLNNGPSFIPGTQTTTFSGVNQSISRAGGETFNNLILSNSGNKTLGSNIAATGLLTINNSVTLDAGAGNNSVSLSGNWTNNGTFIPQQGTVIFNGAAAQTINGTTNTVFYNLTCNNSSAAGVKLNANQRVSNIVSVLSGPLDLTTNTLTLLSTAAQTALIDKLTGATANITGNKLKVQRYIGGQTGWYELGTPVTGLTVGSWAANFPTSGFPGAGTPNFSFTSIYWYNEPSPFPIIDSGWVEPTGLAESINNKGYLCYIGPNPRTISVTGPIASKAGVNIPLTSTNTGTPGVDGWNFVSNPYPAPIDWDNVILSGQTANEIQIWNDAAQQYGVYVQGTGGVGTNGVRNVIASSQSFWVYCTAGTTLALTENFKTTASSTFIKHSAPGTVLNSSTGISRQLKLSINGNAYSDEALINFVNGASVNYDAYYDASKFYSFNPAVPGINTVASDTSGDVDLSINSIPDTTGAIVIPVRATTGTSGVFTIHAEFLDNALSTNCMILEDLATSTFTTLTGNNSYTFSMTDTTKAVRFLLHIGAPIALSSIQPLCSGMANGSAIAQGVGNGPFDYTWMDANNTVVRNVSGIAGSDTLSGVPAGTYTVSIYGNSDGCPQLAGSVTITDPESITADLAVSNATCNNVPNGSIDVLNLANGTAPYSYSWSSGSTSPTLANLSSGTYQLTITDANNCTAQFSANVGTITIPLTVSTGTSSCPGMQDAYIIAEGIGNGPFDYTWTDENNVVIRTVNNVAGPDTLSNLAAGNYMLSVNGNTGTCAQLSQTISIGMTDSIHANISTNDISCNNQQDGSVILNSVVSGTAPYTYLWSNSSATPGISNLSAGDYQLTITDANNCSSHYTVSIGTENNVSAVIDVQDTILFSQGTTVYFGNESQNAFNYQWNFGDGSAADLTEDPQYTYPSFGTYTVQLISSNTTCSDTTYHTIYIINDVTGIKPGISQGNQLSLQHLPGSTFVNVQLEQEEKITISLYNTEGRLMKAPEQHVLKSGRISIATDEFDSGIYFIRCAHGNKLDVFKIVQTK
ncbi:MAG: PKD domain-containing protein, partial [Bacteroidia bacterium]